MSEQQQPHFCVMGERWGKLESELSHIKETLNRTLEQATKTNGRVSTLERWRDRAIAAFAAVCIANPFATAALVSKTPAEKEAAISALLNLATNPAVQSAISGVLKTGTP